MGDSTVAGDVPQNWGVAADVGIDAILTDHPIELTTMLRQHRKP